MTHADINDLETRDFIFKIGDREKAIQARYDENTDALIFPRALFDYVCKLLNEALSQEPCDDAVSREAVLEMAYDMSEIDGEHFTEPHMVVDVEDIQKLSLVTPKSGKWIWSDEIDRYVCDKCGQSDGKDKEMVESGEYPLSNYCPNCGAKMENAK